MSQSPFTPTDQLSITEETAIENGDPIFTREELNQFSNKLLRRMAANANTDEINGKSVQLEVISYFACQRSLAEYAED